MEGAENEAVKKEAVVESMPKAVVAEKPEVETKPKRTKFPMPKLKRTTVITLVVVAAVVAGAVYVAYAKRGWFVAATVNGSPISRLAVIQDLEKQAGKQALDSMITKQLITDEMKKLGVVVKKEEVDAEVKKAEDQVVSQGATLEEALAQQSMTLDDLREQIIIKKELEQALADKVAVSDMDVDQYIKDNKMAPAKGVVSDAIKSQVREQLQSQKFSTEAQAYITDLRAKASIVHYVEY
jgi:hypothetical protein